MDEAKGPAGIVEISEPIFAVCREFTGDYMASSEYVQEVVQYMYENEIPFYERQLLSIYIDNPAHTPVEDLKSIQGVLVDKEVKVHKPYFIYRIEGEFASVTVKGEPEDIIEKAYESLFKFILENHISTQSREDIQIMRIINNEFELQILKKIS